eukprot:353337-Chlamydomonas_euryale.AAC.2
MAYRPLHPAPPALQQTTAALPRSHRASWHEPRRVERLHELGQPRRRAHLSHREEGAIRPSADDPETRQRRRLGKWNCIEFNLNSSSNGSGLCAPYFL